MAPKKYDDKMKLDMPLNEALERFAGTDPAEMRANIEKAKKAKPPGGKRDKKPSGSKGAGDKVASLAQRRTRKRNTGA